MTIQEQYENLEKTVRGYNPAADFQHIRAAFEFAAEAHKDQKRKSGEPYIIHPWRWRRLWRRSCGWTASPSRPPCSTTSSRTPPPPHEQVSKLFSPTIADLVEGVSKLTRIQYAHQGRRADGEPAEDAHRHEQGHPGDPHQDLRPAPQHADHGVPVSRQAEAEVSGDYGDLRPHRPPAGYAAHQVGAGGPVLKISGPPLATRKSSPSWRPSTRSTRTSCAASRSRSTTG